MARCLECNLEGSWGHFSHYVLQRGRISSIYMAVGDEDEDEMIKTSTYVERILRHSTFNDQVEDDALTKENETEQQKGDNQDCRLDGIHGKREDSFLFMLP